MIRKVKAKVAENPAAEKALQTTHKIWLAGLGAFAAAQAEGGRLFKQLAKEGASVEAKGFKIANDSIEKTIAVGSGVFAKARGGFETRVVKPVSDKLGQGVAKFGLPARQDIVALTRQVEALAEQVRALRG